MALYSELPGYHFETNIHNKEFHHHTEICPNIVIYILATQNHRSRF